MFYGAVIAAIAVARIHPLDLMNERRTERRVTADNWLLLSTLAGAILLLLLSP